MVTLAIVIGLVIAALVFVMGMDEDPRRWATPKRKRAATDGDSAVEIE